jgi:fructose-1,6-bisphosphatase/inositol monophosphatase family enzyme
MSEDVSPFLAPLKRLHAEIRAAVVETTERAADGALAAIAEDAEGDTIYAVDRVSDERLVAFFAKEIAPWAPLVLVAEGLPGGRVTLPHGLREDDARWRVLVDPIDGTRGLMYQKRSAWILTGVAPNRGPATGLHDVALAVQTEIPLVKQHLSDTLWAVKSEGAHAERFDRLTGETREVHLRPSGAPTIAHGFAMVARFFPGAREELAAIDEEIVRGALGPVRAGKAHCFEDQYICSGGQLYELIAGHDRFVADLRPLMETHLAARGLRLGICCHPYDLATELIAREAGVIVTDPEGRPLEAPLDCESDVAWVGYANEAVRAQVEPLLQAALRSRGLLPERR